MDSPSNIRLFAGLKISGTNTKLGNLNRAVEVSQNLTESHPQQYESWFSYANASGALKNYTQAIAAFKMSIELKPKEGLGKVGLAFALFPDPVKAFSDGPQSLKPSKFSKLMKNLRPFAELMDRTLSDPIKKQTRVCLLFKNWYTAYIQSISSRCFKSTNTSLTKNYITISFPK